MIVMVMGAQMGKTENLFNVLGHRFDDGPYVPALFIGATEKMVRSMSKDRFYKMIQSTESLRSKVDGGQKYTLMEQFFGGVRLGWGWAGSPTELASHPAGLVLIDEVDRMVTDVGNEGDPVSLAAARTKNFSGAKIGISSTPTIAGASAIESHYRSGTMGRYQWPCPHCGEFFTPEFKYLEWPKDSKGHSDPGEALEGAFVRCPNCAGTLENRHKGPMNAAGRYMFHVEHGEDGELVPAGLEPPLNNTASFWVSGLCSPWVTFGEMAVKWIAANSSGEMTRRQTIINTEFGEWWAQDGQRPEYRHVRRLVDDYAEGVRDDRVQMITMGVDVGGTNLHYSVWGWGYNSESWLLQHGELQGDTAFDDVWIRLTRIRETLYNDMPILYTFIDSGFRPGDTDVVNDHMVYKYCRNHGNAFPVKGQDMMDVPYRARKIDITLTGRVIKGGLMLFHVNTHYFKTFLHDKIRMDEEYFSQPGRMHLHADTTEGFCRQLISEELVIRPSGKPIWVRKGPNHYLDTAVYAACAAAHAGVGTLPRDPTPPGTAKSEASQDSERYVKAPRKGYIRR